MGARGPSLVLAVFITASTGALGFLALGAAAHADPAAPAAACGGIAGPLCPPSGTVSGFPPPSAGGDIVVTWAPGQAGVTIDSPTLTVTWLAPAALPTNVTPPPLSATLTGTCVSPSGSSNLVCTYKWAPLVNGYVVNGNYKVQGMARDCPILQLGACSATASASPASTAVSNAASPAKAPTAELIANNAQVKVTWGANPEPDIAGYQVFRADKSVACQVAAASGATTSYSCIDAPTKDGSYSYTVVAYRYSASFDPHINKELAGPASTATKTVTVTGTSANSTTSSSVPIGGRTLAPPGFTAKPLPNPAAAGGNGAFAGRPPSPSPAVVAPGTATSVDSGFVPTLPYGQANTTLDTGTTDPSAIAAPVAPHKSKSSVATIAVVGAGLLIAVVAMHGLWLRSEVRRDPALEVLDPEH